jgi:hypothetical protein
MNTEISKNTEPKYFLNFDCFSLNGFCDRLESYLTVFES